MKPSIPKGTRDFSPVEVAKRNYIFSTIKKEFETYGFQPIETPSFENSSTLMGKYGEEGDRLIFKILNSGDYMRSLEKDFNYFHIYQKSAFFFFDKLINRAKNLRKVTPQPSKEEILFTLESDFDGYPSKKKSVPKSFIEIHNYYDVFIDHLKDKKSIFIPLVYSNVFLDNDKEKFQFKTFLYHEFKFNVINKITPKISEKALRYDLTVPFARYVVQHQNDITFPFKRYQMQPVWRADRPQKGRFREFYQCDADVVGSKSLWQEVEFVQLYDTVFTKLGLKKTIIKLNNRKILSGIAEVIDAKDKLIDFTVALDKLDKIGAEGVTNEMIAKGISEEAIEKVKPLFDFTGDNQEKLKQLRGMLSSSEEGLQGIDELQFVVGQIDKLGLQSSELEIDVTLARGLNYYTGAIFEVKANEVSIGSIGGGGRYDDLTGIFGLKNISGIGISFGLDRIYLVLEELDLFQRVDLPKPKVMFVNFGEKEALYSMQAMKELRSNDVKSELYPDTAKMKKQMNYANKRKIEFVVLVGDQEVTSNSYTLKNMSTGEQTNCNLRTLVRLLSKN